MSLLDVAMSRARSVALDKIAATGAALATIAAVLLMPVGILQEAVLASGMADGFAPLQPPLGLRARLGLSLLAAGSAFGMVLLLMRLVVRTPARRPTPIADVEGGPVPKLRRRDRHPDAPARSPLSVSRDLGIDLDAAEEDEPAQAPARTLLRSRRDKAERAPSIRRETEDPVRAATPWLRKADQDDEAAPLPRLTRVERAAGWAPAEEALEPAPVAEEPHVQAWVAPEPEPQVFEPEVEQAIAPEPEPEPVHEPEPETSYEPEPEPVAEGPAAGAGVTPAWLEEQRPVPQTEAPAPREESIAELVARFERAMDRRMSAPRPTEAASLRDEEESDRLRSALESLKRFAPRQG